MKAKDLAALLLKHPEADVCEAFTDYQIVGLVYEDDGLKAPRVFPVSRMRQELYDEDYEHGFHVT